MKRNLAAFIFILAGFLCAGCDSQHREEGQGTVSGTEAEEMSQEEYIHIRVFTTEDVEVTPEITEYDYNSACKMGEVKELRGMLPGMGEGTWYTVAIGGVEYYYAAYDYSPDTTELFEYAIVGGEYSLANGISVGMTKKELLERYPDMAILDTENNVLNNVTGHMGWNHTAYPRSPVGMDEEWDYGEAEYYLLGQPIRLYYDCGYRTGAGCPAAFCGADDEG